MTRKLALFLVLIMLAAMPAYAATSAPGVLPIVDEPTTVSILMIDSLNVVDYDDNTLTKFYESETGIDLEFVFLPEADPATKLNLMISSGEKLPDVISYGLSLTDAYNYAGTGAFIALNDLIDKYGVNFKAINAAYPDLAIAPRCTSADGNIYGLPQVTYAESDSVWQNAWINKQWLEALDLEAPTTTEELYNVLVAFRDGDPNGNGKKDEIPLTGATTAWSKNVVNWLLNSFVYADATDYINLKDGQVYGYYRSDAYREGLRYINKLFEEGLLDNQCLTQTSDQMMAMVQTDGEEVVGAFMNMSTRKGFVFDALIPVTGPEGAGYTAYNGPTVTPHWFITSDCENPEVAFRLGDYMLQDDCYFNLRMRYGSEGEYWARLEDIDEELIVDEKDMYAILLQEDGQTYKDAWSVQHSEHWQRNQPCFYYNWDEVKATYAKFEANPELMNETELDAYYRTQAARKQQFSCVEKCIPSADVYIPFLSYNEEETALYSEIRPDLYTYVEEMRAAFITGAADLDADWDSYLAQLKVLRLDEFEALVQGAYDRNYK